MNLKMIDMHLHLDEAMFSTAHEAAEFLSKTLHETGIEHGIVLHLLTQKWELEDFVAAINKCQNLSYMVNLDPNNQNIHEILPEIIENKDCKGVKLHPRIHGFLPDEPHVIQLVKAIGDKNLPVLIDAFPDGDALLAGFSPRAYATMASATPETKIIWAHMGGHHVLDFAMMAKRLSNVWMDCSFSMMYYKNTHVMDSIIYAIKNLKFEKVMYGSDYPDRQIKESLDFHLKLFNDSQFSQSGLEKVMYRNAKAFFL